MFASKLAPFYPVSLSELNLWFLVIIPLGIIKLWLLIWCFGYYPSFVFSFIMFWLTPDWYMPGIILGVWNFADILPPYPYTLFLHLNLASKLVYLREQRFCHMAGPKSCQHLYIPDTSDAVDWPTVSPALMLPPGCFKLSYSPYLWAHVQVSVRAW